MSQIIPKPEDKDAPFNMAMMFYIELDRLKTMKNNAFLSGDMIGYCTTLQAIVNEISFQIKNGEKKAKTIEMELENIDKKLSRAEQILNAPIPPDKNLAVQVIGMNYGFARKILMEVDRDANSILDKYKMIFPRIETMGGLDKLREKMGITK